MLMSPGRYLFYSLFELYVLPNEMYDLCESHNAQDLSLMPGSPPHFPEF